MTLLFSKPFFLASLFTLALSSVEAKDLIYDDFGEAGDINGRTPKTSMDGAIWQGGKKPRQIISVGSSVLIDTSLLQLTVVDVGVGFFENNPGVYALSMDVAFPDESGSDSMWVAIGFNNGNKTTASFNDSNSDNGGSPWMFLRARGDVHVFAGRGTGRPLANTAADYPAGPVYRLKLVLDTRDASWTLNAFVNENQIDLGRHGEATYTFIRNPEIRYIGFSANPAVAPSDALAVKASIDNFRLEEVSEQVK